MLNTIPEFSIFPRIVLCNTLSQLSIKFKQGLVQKPSSINKRPLKFISSSDAEFDFFHKCRDSNLTSVEF